MRKSTKRIDVQRELFDERAGINSGALWETVASPKPGPTDKNLFGHFVSHYASFSEQFALDAISNLSCCGQDVILDPFVGTGTTLSAATRLGLKSKGFDLSPFSVAVCKLRFAPQPSRSQFAQILTRRGRKEFSFDSFTEETRSLFSAKDLRLLSEQVPFSDEIDTRKWIRKILWSSPIRLTDHDYVFLCTVLAANKAAKVSTGSNPVWIRRLLDGENEQRSTLKVCWMSFKSDPVMSPRFDPPIFMSVSS